MRSIAITALLTLAGCATDEPEVDGPPVISKVVVMEIPVSKAPAQHDLSYGSPCFTVPLATPHDCSVSATDHTTGIEAIVQTCDASPTARPCYAIVPDQQNCFEADHLKLDVNFDGLSSYDLTIHLQCVSL